MAKEDIIKHQFKKGQSGNPNGRPKKFITTLKAQGYRANEIKDTIEVMLALTKAELKDVSVNDTEHTIMEVTIAKAILKSLEKGSLDSIETLLSRAFGQPKQEMDVTHDIQPVMFPDVKYKEEGSDDK